MIDGLDDAHLTSRAWDALIHSRAMVFDDMAARTRRVAPAADSSLNLRLEACQLAGTRLANLIVRGPGDTDPAIYRRWIGNFIHISALTPIKQAHRSGLRPFA